MSSDKHNRKLIELHDLLDSGDELKVVKHFHSAHVFDAFQAKNQCRYTVIRANDEVIASNSIDTVIGVMREQGSAA